MSEVKAFSTETVLSVVSRVWLSSSWDEVKELCQWLAVDDDKPLGLEEWAEQIRARILRQHPELLDAEPWLNYFTPDMWRVAREGIIESCRAVYGPTIVLSQAVS